ncbi:nucleoside-diphosphate sugar epimerase/dehydratase [Pseudarthrobacter sp. AL07]|uniref:polysaccharide biosynthesis protein n=1 Tax=unclassified Pseudarthrobacter TaxID=2647000 RepID=UPI00249AFC0A|nr:MULTISPECIES: nucleoside-diphosphate sugar epimerase/dehydratase [unclassified Pseudarthrobacter]MDI3195996.1 nucleoside-diphosphate sugar epimerase/dehydratase [Pseudarthrobacter sp. AL20]MDI3210063.1 nucleoside-diphosphate sugar epimerase/dehydratase [Pseudarthrobacter sp. AL07]
MNKFKGSRASFKGALGKFMANSLRWNSQYNEHLARFGHGAQSLLDAVAWTVGLIGAVYFRYEFDSNQMNWSPLLAVCAALAISQFLFGWIFWLYRGRYSSGSFEEAAALLLTVFAVALVVGVPVFIFGSGLEIPRSATVIALPLAFLLMGSTRYLRRLNSHRLIKPHSDAKRTLVYGAGHMGHLLIRNMLADRHAGYHPVGLIDDDLTKRNLRIAGVPVLGDSSRLPDIASLAQAEVLIVCITRAESGLLRSISDSAFSCGLQVKVLPALSEIMDGKAEPADVRDIAIEDLIGRHPVDTEMATIAGYLKGKRVLVTGAGGSIGSELCRQIVRFEPAELMMLDRDESGLQGAQISIAGHGLLDTKDVVLADIRDSEALGDIFRERKPEVVFHAAALKHLPMLEQYPGEAWKTNVLGTLNVLNVAREAGVSTFVNISTDKAADPSSVLGHSKRLAEQLTAWAAANGNERYLSVRFGNVIGSRGSMLPTFQSLIAAGGPLTITHPEVTRFFMTIPEACQLVVQAGGIGSPGEVLILDMGEPVRIQDVAERMIAASGKDIEIVYTGLREGEKLHEVLVSHDETDVRPIHPKISHTQASPLTPDDLDVQAWDKKFRDTDKIEVDELVSEGHG